MKKPNNAFLLYGYHSPEYFCGRKKELTELKNHRLNERNVALYSWRGMGRSALIHRFLMEEERKGKLEAIYVDLTGTVTLTKCIEIIIKGIFERYLKSVNSINTDFQRILTSIAVNITTHKKTNVPQFNLGYRTQNQLIDNLNTLGQFLSLRKKKIYVVFKEFQQIANYEEAQTAKILSNFSKKFASIRFIFSGSHRHKMVFMFTDQNQAFNRSCQLISLDPVHIDEFTPFIQKHFKAVNRKISTEQIQEVYSWTRGQTQAIQLICNKLYAMEGETSTVGLREIFHEVLQENALVFANYHRLLSKVQWKLIIAIAKENEVEKPQSATFLAKYNLGAASSIKVALEALITKELVIAENGKFYVHDLLFFRWLEQL